MTRATNLNRWETDGGHIEEPAEEPADEARQVQVDHVGRQLAAVAERLCREFAPGGGAAAESIRDQVRDARDAFGAPRVIAYLPLLVERTVRRRLVLRPEVRAHPGSVHRPPPV